MTLLETPKTGFLALRCVMYSIVADSNCSKQGRKAKTVTRDSIYTHVFGICSSIHKAGLKLLIYHDQDNDCSHI